MSTFDSNLPRQLIRECKNASKRTKAVDSTGASLTGGDLLIRTLALLRMLKREVLADDEKTVGVLLPPSVPACVVNFALAFDQRISINLNYTVSSEILNKCCEVGEVKHVLTSRKFVEKVGIELDCNVIYLEDLKEKVSLTDKLSSLFWAKVAPTQMLERHLGVNAIDKDDPLTVIFTSGSTGIPKGVVLTYENIASNVHGIASAVGLNSDDVVLGILPFFHSFGYTVTLWTALSLPPMGVYHYNPLDARQIGKLAETHSATVLLGTPTFLRTYIRRIEPAQFSKLDVVVVGAEKMPLGLAEEFEKKFGIRPVEGYGTTELSPVVAVNRPPTRTSDTDETRGLKEGSVGRCLDGVEARIVDPDSGDALANDMPGMLEIRGPNVMKGYLNRDDLTEEVIRDGWYRTGDIAKLDDAGFIHITGRLSRFSKIGGEMVPHIQIEEAINEQIEQPDEGIAAVVTAVPDPKRGERLIVLHTGLSKPVEELTKALSVGGLPNLFIPSNDAFIQVDSIPMLGTGKLDLKGIKDLATDRT